MMLLPGVILIWIMAIFTVNEKYKEDNRIANYSSYSHKNVVSSKYGQESKNEAK